MEIPLYTPTSLPVFPVQVSTEDFHIDFPGALFKLKALTWGLHSFSQLVEEYIKWNKISGKSSKKTEENGKTSYNDDVSSTMEIIVRLDESGIQRTILKLRKVTNTFK